MKTALGSLSLSTWMRSALTPGYRNRFEKLPCFILSRPSTLTSSFSIVSFSTQAPSSLLHLKDPNLKGSLISTQNSTTAVTPNMFFNNLVPSRAETLEERVLRWIDITGVISRWSHRKNWVMDLSPDDRTGTIMVTEYERKMLHFMSFHCVVFYVISVYFLIHAHQHLNCRPPLPKHPPHEYLNVQRRDFNWHSAFFSMQPKGRCKECRWLELECKKKCFDKLKAEGHQLIFNHGNPLSVPRQTLEAPHAHH